MDNLFFDVYDLIGIGEFSHGIEESWIFRYTLLKLAIKKTNKTITIFNEMDEWQSNNIMNNTYYDRDTDTFINDDKNTDALHIESVISDATNGYVGGKLWQYIYHSMESKIFVKIIKYIRKHKNRVNIVGTDNGQLDRDFAMAEKIISSLDTSHINFFWAHNAHIDDRLLSNDTYHWIKDTHPNHKYSCGHYLRKVFEDRYCIILSQAHSGVNRFNGYCKGFACSDRTNQLKYIYHKFKYCSNKNYIDNDEKYQLLIDYTPKLLEYSNSYYLDHIDPIDNISGYQDLVKSHNWTFILFWNKVHALKPYNE